MKNNPYSGTMRIVKNGRTDEQICQAAKYNAIQAIIDMGAKGMHSVDLSNFEPVRHNSG